MCNTLYCCILCTNTECVHSILLVFLMYIIHCGNCPMVVPSHTHDNESTAVHVTWVHLWEENPLDLDWM